MRLPTKEGAEVHLELPSGFVAGVIGLLGILVSFMSWTAIEVVHNSRTIINHDTRLNYIEESRFTESDFRNQSTSFVSIREYEALSQRLDRIEDKLDRALR